MNKLDGMQPDARKSLVAALSELQSNGIPVHINSGFRSPQQQKALYAKYLAGDNPYPVAPPGHSNHERGLAADLGIDPAHRDAANDILASHGWNWHGPSDEVHYDYKGSGGAPDKTLTALDQQNNQFSRVMGNIQSGAPAGGYAPSPSFPAGSDAGKFFGGGQPAAAAASQFPAGSDAGKFFSGGSTAGSFPPISQSGQSSPVPPNQPAPGELAQDRGVLGNIGQYWKNWGSSVFGGAEAGGFGQRVQAAFQPIPDLLNAADQYTGGVLNFAMRPFSSVWNGAAQAIQTAQTNPNDQQFFGAVGNSMARAWNGQQDPTLPAGGMFGAIFNKRLAEMDALAKDPGTTPFEGGLATFASGVLRDIMPVGEMASQWEAGGKYAHEVFKPILRGVPGVTQSVLSTAAGEGPFAGIAAKVSPVFDNALVNRGVSGLAKAGLEAANRAAWAKWGDNPIGQTVLPLLQAFAKTGPDYNKGLDEYVKQTAIMRTADSLLDRVTTQIKDYSAKLNAAGVPIIGNSLDGSQYDLPELKATGLMEGNLVGHFVTLYQEIGSQGAILTEPELMRQVSEKGLDWDTIKKIGEEAKSIDMLAGRGQVDTGLMTPETFAENAGRYTPRSYQINKLTKTDATALAFQMEQGGQAGTDLHARVKNIAENGGAEMGGAFNTPPGLRDIVHQRELLTAMDRLNSIPDLDYTHSTQAIRSQFQEIAKTKLMHSLADPKGGISLANEFGSSNIKQKPVTSSPKFQGELARGVKNAEAIKQSFEKSGGANDVQDELAGKLDKSIANARAAQAALAAHTAAQPVEPPMPGGRAPVPNTNTAGPLETAEQRVARQHAARPANVLAEQAKQTLDQKDLDQYAKDLNTWQREKATWGRRLTELTQRTETTRAAVDAARQAHDAHVQAGQQRLVELDKQRLRNELLSGKRPANYGDAEDALNKAIAKVPGAETMTPELQDEWKRTWLESWNERNEDIFHEIPPQGLPLSPYGLDPKAIEAIGGNNPLIALALNDKLSFGDKAIDAASAAKLGLTRWGSDKGEYGAMNNRWAPIALKNFIDDAMDPNRFTGSAKGATAGMSKFLGEMIRTGKLYMNPISTANVFVQSVVDNMATAADAGKTYNPLSDSQGRAGYHAWVHGGPMMPHIQAMLDYGNEMAGGQRHGVDPFLQSAKDPLAGLTGPLKTGLDAFRGLKGAMRDKFVSEQLLPKAGLVKVLMDQGMDGPTAAQWAERAHGGAGANMGGLETPGMMHLAENLNRQGVAMFTSYPLHSISRIMEMMVTRPDLVMRYPLLRNYMIQASSSEAQAQARQHNLEYSEVPIPTNNPIGRLFADPNGSEGTINLSNAIPYGGAFGGLGFPNIANPFIRVSEIGDRAEKAGLNPADTRGAKADAFIKSVTPGSIYAMWKVYAASQGNLPSPGATMAQTVPQTLTAFAGLPMRHPETGMSREFGPQKGFEIPSRLETMQELDRRYALGYTHGEHDFTDNYDLRNMDPEELEHARMAAVKEMDRIAKDKSISEADATRMLRNQSGYIHSLMALATRQGARLFDYTEQAMKQGAQ